MQSGTTLLDKDGEPVRQLPLEEGASRDKAIAWLAAETVSAGHSVLIFCAARWVRAQLPAPFIDLKG